MESQRCDFVAECDKCTQQNEPEAEVVAECDKIAQQNEPEAEAYGNEKRFR